MRTNAKWRLVVLALSTLLPVSVWTQSFTGSISGTIKDPSGAVIPNVEVTLKSLATGVEAKFATGSDGLYHFQGLPQGTYRAQGFSTRISKFPTDRDYRSYKSGCNVGCGASGRRGVANHRGTGQRLSS